MSLPWYKQKTVIGNGPFVAYLLILVGFWASFYQIFVTMPEFIRDFVDTRDLLPIIGIFGQGAIEFLAAVNVPDLSVEIGRLISENGGALTAQMAHDVYFQLVHYKVQVPQEEIIQVFATLTAGGVPDAAMLTAQAQTWADAYRQVNPEYIINLDAGAIIIFQIMVSAIIDRWKPFPVLVVGTIVAGLGIGLCGFSLAGVQMTGIFVIIAIVVFAFGEMIASPKSQEYVARIAPKQKTALFMGYYFVSVALGNLVGGILSGWGYEKVAKDMNNPGLMWIIFGCVGFLTAIALVYFNKTVVPKLEAQRETNAE